MSEAGTTVQIVVEQNEDFVCQFLLTDDLGNQMALVGPAGMVCTDLNLTRLFAADTQQPAATEPCLTVATFGFVTLTIPQVITAMFTPGTYVFDLFVEVVDNSTFTSRTVKILDGGLVVRASVTQPSDIL